MAELIQFEELNDFIAYNTAYLENNYLSHYNLIKMLAMLNRGHYEVLDAFNIEDAGCSILCLAFTGHLLIYSTEWNDEMIEELERRVPLKTLKDFQFMGQRALVLDILKRNDISYKVIKDRLVYECTATNDLELSQGRMEQAQMQDLQELAQMSFDYHNEEYKGEGFRDLQHMTEVARQGIENSTLFNWVDDQITSIVQILNPNEPISVIGQLFTKEEQRNNGYGCSLLHALTNYQFENGVEKCGLLSDVTNHASNKVFVKVGYRPIYELILCIENSGENK